MADEKEGVSWVDKGGWFELIRNDGAFWSGETPAIEEYNDGTWGVLGTDESTTPLFATRAEAENHAIGLAIKFYLDVRDDALEQIYLLSPMQVGVPLQTHPREGDLSK